MHMTNNKDIKNIVKETVGETLSGLGFSSSDPNEIQADLIYLRKMRTGSEEMSKLIKKCIITVTIPSFLYIVWEALKKALN